MNEFIKHYRIRSGKDPDSEVERVKKEMERDGITGYRKLTEEDREKMQQIAKKMGYREVDQ